jgi:alpha/beta superfamily hydrolase
VASPSEVERVVAKLRTQKGITIAYDLVEGANHYWSDHLDEVEIRTGAYLDRRMAGGKS